MSEFASRDQQLAQIVYQRVAQFEKERRDQSQNKKEWKKEDDPFIKQYGSMAHKLPVLIRSAGLAQAIAFVQAKSGTQKAYARLLTDLASVTGFDDLAAESRDAQLDQYMLMTESALACLLWFKRYSQSVLNVEAGDEPAEESTDLPQGGSR